LSPSNFAAGAWLHQRDCFRRCEAAGHPIRPLINVNVADDNLHTAELLPALRYLDAKLATAQEYGIFTNAGKSNIHVPGEMMLAKQNICSLDSSREPGQGAEQLHCGADQ
jgi:hypothetical protein